MLFDRALQWDNDSGNWKAKIVYIVFICVMEGLLQKEAKRYAMIPALPHISRGKYDNYFS
jgi:hypothetical protein